METTRKEDELRNIKSDTRDIKEKRINHELSTMENSYFCTPKEQSKGIKTVKDSFTFRNRNIKLGVMKKIDSFLDMIETEEKIMKKDKGSYLNELNTLENKLKILYPKSSQSSEMADEQ